MEDRRQAVNSQRLEGEWERVDQQVEAVIEVQKWAHDHKLEIREDN